MSAPAHVISCHMWCHGRMQAVGVLGRLAECTVQGTPPDGVPRPHMDGAQLVELWPDLVLPRTVGRNDDRLIVNGRDAARITATTCTPCRAWNS